MRTRVTWLLSVRNGMPFLPETLASIEAQTYRDWEVLAWDACSTDGTLEELRKWIPSRLPGRIISVRPLGLAASLAEMVRLARTELCARIDADDVNFPHRLERQVEFMRRHPEISVLGGQMTVTAVDGVDRGAHTQWPLDHQDIVHFLLHACPLAHPTVVFRKSAVLEAGNYPDIVAEDYGLWLRMATRYRMANLGEVLVRYRMHSGSATQRLVAENRAEMTAIDCFCSQGVEPFGCSQTELRRLRERNHRCAAWAILRIAWHLHRIQGGSLMGRLRSQSLLNAVQVLRRPRDVLSGRLMAALHPRQYWRSSLVPRLKRLAGKFPVLKGKT